MAGVVVAWAGAAVSLLCLWGCRAAVQRVLGLERLHASLLTQVWRKSPGAGSEPAEVEAARKVP